MCENSESARKIFRAGVRMFSVAWRGSPEFEFRVMRLTRGTLSGRAVELHDAENAEEQRTQRAQALTVPCATSRDSLGNRRSGRSERHPERLFPRKFVRARWATWLERSIHFLCCLCLSASVSSAEHPGRGPYARATRNTSSSVVIPARTARSPSSSSVRIPFAIPMERSSSDPRRRCTSRRSSLSITSNS